MDLLGPCTNVFLTAYAHVRTEPQCDIGQTRGKKDINTHHLLWVAGVLAKHEYLMLTSNTYDRGSL